MDVTFVAFLCAFASLREDGFCPLGRGSAAPGSLYDYPNPDESEPKRPFGVGVGIGIGIDIKTGKKPGPRPGWAPEKLITFCIRSHL